MKRGTLCGLCSEVPSDPAVQDRERQEKLCKSQQFEKPKRVKVHMDKTVKARHSVVKWMVEDILVVVMSRFLAPEVNPGSQKDQKKKMVASL
jgi:hypothetical protein